MGSTPISPNCYTPITALIERHEGSPQAVAFFVKETINFLQTQSRLDCDASLQQALIQDLSELHDAFAQL